MKCVFIVVVIIWQVVFFVKALKLCFCNFLILCCSEGDYVFNFKFGFGRVSKFKLFFLFDFRRCFCISIFFKCLSFLIFHSETAYYYCYLDGRTKSDFSGLNFVLDGQNIEAKNSYKHLGVQLS